MKGNKMFTLVILFVVCLDNKLTALRSWWTCAAAGSSSAAIGIAGSPWRPSAAPRCSAAVPAPGWEGASGTARRETRNRWTPPAGGDMGVTLDEKVADCSFQLITFFKIFFTKRFPDLMNAAEKFPVKHHQLIGHFLRRHVVKFAVARRPVDLLRKRKLQEVTSQLKMKKTPDRNPSSLLNFEPNNRKYLSAAGFSSPKHRN